MTRAPGSPVQPESALPMTSLLVGHCLAGAGAALLWLAGTLGSGQSRPILVAGLIEVALVTTLAVGSILVILPWRIRPVGTWAVVLITTSLVRVIVTIGLSVLLYSAAQLAPKALVVSAFVAFIAGLVVETTITSRFMSRLRPGSAPERG